MLGEGGWIVVLIKFFPGLVMGARADKFEWNIYFVQLILQCNMCFCQIYVGTALFDRVVEVFGSSPKFLVPNIQHLQSSWSHHFYVTCLKGRKLWVHFILHLASDLYSSVLPFRNESLTSIALGFANLTVRKLEYRDYAHIFSLIKLIILYSQYRMTCRGELSKPQGVLFVMTCAKRMLAFMNCVGKARKHRCKV